MTEPPVTGSAHIGSYELEVGLSAESFAQFEPEQDDENARAVRAALAEPPDEHPFVTEVEELQESAAAVTHQIERANELFRAAAEGHLLEPSAVATELDALLGLFKRLDRSGRFDEELRLARALYGLLVLAVRWLDLVRMLRATLRSAQAAGSQPGQAWALHEVGSLHLCAGDPEAAADHLGEALQREQSLGEAAGRCATRHNLDCARRDVVLQAAAGGWGRRLLRLTGLVAVLAILAAGGTAIAFAVSDHSVTSTGGTSAGASTGTGSTGPGSTTGTTSPPDTTAPSVSLMSPINGSTVVSSTPELSGAAGTDAGDQPTVRVLVSDEAGSLVAGSPFSAPVDNGAWRITSTTNLPDGSYSAVAEQRDDGGHTGRSARSTFTIDTTPPTLILGCPATITLRSVCTLTSSDAGNARVHVYEVFRAADGTKSERLLPNSMQVPLEADAEARVTLQLPALERNGVAFRIVAVENDEAGNEGTSNSEQLEPVQ